MRVGAERRGDPHPALRPADRPFGPRPTAARPGTRRPGGRGYSRRCRRGCSRLRQRGLAGTSAHRYMAARTTSPRIHPCPSPSRSRGPRRPRPRPPAGDLGFGRFFSDHMFLAEHEGKGWSHGPGGAPRPTERRPRRGRPPVRAGDVRGDEGGGRGEGPAPLPAGAACGAAQRLGAPAVHARAAGGIPPRRPPGPGEGGRRPGCPPSAAPRSTSARRCSAPRPTSGCGPRAATPSSSSPRRWGTTSDRRRRCSSCGWRPSWCGRPAAASARPRPAPTTWPG